MELHRLLGDPELARDVAVSRSSGHETQDLELSCGQLTVRLRDTALRVELCEDSRLRWMLNDVPIDGLADQRRDRPRMSGFRDRAHRAGGEDGVEPLRLHRARQHDHRHIGVAPLDLADQSDGLIRALHVIHQHDVWRRVEHRRDLPRPGVDVAEQLELAALAQAERDGLDDQRVVRDDDESLHRSL